METPSASVVGSMLLSGKKAAMTADILRVTDKMVERLKLRRLGQGMLRFKENVMKFLRAEKAILILQTAR